MTEQIGVNRETETYSGRGCVSIDIALEPQTVPTAKKHRELSVALFLFRSTKSAPIWLIVRLWLGWQWLDAGWDKATGAGYDNWLSHPQGLQGFIASGNAAWQHRALTHG